MTADIEQIKKKIIYRSNYRGTKAVSYTHLTLPTTSSV